MSSQITDRGLAYRQLARIVLADEPLGNVLNRIAQLATTMLPSGTEVSVTLVSAGGHPGTVACGPGAKAAPVLDRFQYVSGSGPTLDAAGHGQTVSILNTDKSDSYREFSRQASHLGIRRAVAVGLPKLHETSGAVNAYGRQAEFDQQAHDVLVEVASHAAIAMVNSALRAGAPTEIAQLRSAMTARTAIEQAKGIIMGRRCCTQERAFQLLQEVSARTHRPLADVAHDIVMSTERRPGGQTPVR